MSRLLSILEDQAGGLSTMRVVLLLWSIGILVAWSVCSIKAGTLQSLPESIVTLFGIGMAGKVIQRPLEKPEPLQP